MTQKKDQLELKPRNCSSATSTNRKKKNTVLSLITFRLAAFVRDLRPKRFCKKVKRKHLGIE